jgi:FKBP-type peptidyl-prolyl cis-trans isomerase
MLENLTDNSPINTNKARNSTSAKIIKLIYCATMDKKHLTIILAITAFAAGALIYSFIIKPAINTNTNNNINKTNTTNTMSTQELKIEILKEGSGEEAKTGNTVTVNYTGMLTNGTKFDSSVDPAFGHVEPFPFTLGENRVIQGWELGVKGMKVGEKRKLTIPAELGYGDRAIGNMIPANSTLIFEVELLKIN